MICVRLICPKLSTSMHVKGTDSLGVCSSQIDVCYFSANRAVNKGNNKISEQSNKGKVKTHKYINRQNQSTTGKL